MSAVYVNARVRLIRSILIFTIATFVAWLAGCTMIGIFAIEGALHLPHLALTQQDRDRAAEIARQDGADFTDAEITAADGAVLRAWSIRARGGNGNFVMLLHGQGDNRAAMLGSANMLLRHGFSVLLPDARGHGESGGAITTYGVLEADDIRRWFDWLRKEEPSGCIDGLGDSMGGAELLRSLDAERGFCAVIAESPFATFREAAYDRLGQQFGRGPRLGRTLLRPAFGVGVLYVRARYGVDLEKADPARAVAASTVPVMLIHGLADRNLPARHSETIKRASPRVALWEPKGADHCEASTVEPVEYERRVAGWFENHKQQ
jgi:fermentation-respiration switch protein FrsA (DUF1100 family)